MSDDRPTAFEDARDSAGPGKNREIARSLVEHDRIEDETRGDPSVGRADAAQVRFEREWEFTRYNRWQLQMLALAAENADNDTA